jgi:mannose-6-phosphate isomerase-like protein (cupin superfamily)
MTEGQSFFKNYRENVTTWPDRYAKSTLFETGAILVGMNVLDHDQCLDKHAHREQNRFYLVLEGTGLFRVGEQEDECGPGMVIWVPAGNPHRVENHAGQPLVLLVGIAPAHAD